MPQDFRVSLLGGSWLARTRGLSYDAFKGSIRRGSDAEAWAEHFGLQRSSRYGISKYEETGANLCAYTWCCAMNRFYQLWHRAGNQEYQYSEEDLGSWRPSAAFMELLPALTAGARSRAEGPARFRPGSGA